MTKQLVFDHFKALGIEVQNISLALPERNSYRVVTNAMYLGKYVAQSIVNMPGFKQLCVSWGGDHPRIIIFISRYKPLVK